MVERVLQIAEACIEDLSEYGHLHKDARDHQVQMHPNNILQNIFYFRVCSYTEQIALVNYLDKFITEHKSVGVKIHILNGDCLFIHLLHNLLSLWTIKVLFAISLFSFPFLIPPFFFLVLLQVKIIILDSVTFHFRQEFDDMARRTRLLSDMALKFMKLSKKFGLAVRITILSLLCTYR